MKSQYYLITVSDPKNKNKQQVVKTLNNFKSVTRFGYLASLPATKNEPCRVTISLCYASSSLVVKLDEFECENRAQLIATLINAHEIDKRV